MQNSNNSKRKQNLSISNQMARVEKKYSGKLEQNPIKSRVNGIFDQNQQQFPTLLKQSPIVLKQTIDNDKEKGSNKIQLSTFAHTINYLNIQEGRISKQENDNHFDLNKKYIQVRPQMINISELPKEYRQKRYFFNKQANRLMVTIPSEYIQKQENNNLRMRIRQLDSHIIDVQSYGRLMKEKQQQKNHTFIKPKKKVKNKCQQKKNKNKKANIPQNKNEGRMPIQQQEVYSQTQEKQESVYYQQRQDRKDDQRERAANPIPYRLRQKQQSPIIKKMWIFYKQYENLDLNQQIYLQKIQILPLFQKYVKQKEKQITLQQFSQKQQVLYSLSSSQSSSSESEEEIESESEEYFQGFQLNHILDDDSQIVNVNKLIIDNHIGEVSEYSLPLPKKKWRIFNHFDNKKKYCNILSQLMKFEIIAGVNQRINQKAQEQFQKQIFIKVNQRINLATKQKENFVVPQNDQQHTKLLQIMIKGPRLGILIKKSQLPFTIQKLYNKQSTRLCFLEKKKETEQLILTYMKGWNINEKWEMVFLDLEAIVSWKRQYKATINIRYNFMINFLVKSKKGIIQNRKKTDFSKECRNILSFIKSTQNQDQYRIIQHFSQKQKGLYLMQGPPGTGKTETICNYAFVQHSFLKKIKNPSSSIKQYHQFQFKNLQEQSEVKGFTKEVVMICSQSNAAVNNVARKILRNPHYGQRLKLNVLRLGHTEQYDEQLLSINLPHLVQTELLKGVKQQFPKSSAQLRADKTLKYELINKIMSETPEQTQLIGKQKKKLFQIIKKLVQIDQYTRKNKQKYRIIQQYFLMKSQIVLSTLNTTGKQRFSKFYQQQKSVRCLIIDEASQATEPSTLIPMMTNVKKTILVGDHKQLQPTIMSKNYRSTNFNRSLFERLIDAGKKQQLLRYQYRMVSELKDFSNKHFYQSKLKDGVIVKQPPYLTRIKNRSIFFDVAYGQQQKLKSSFFNESECQCVQKLVIKLLDYNSNLNIGVITPYKSQEKCILEGFTEEIKRRCKVSTVDAFQGQERDIIIVSCVRANDKNEIGFVRDEKRMNVTITRAKYCFFVFGNADTISPCSLWNQYLIYHSMKCTYVKLDRLHANQIIQRHIPTFARE